LGANQECCSRWCWWGGHSHSHRTR